MTASPHSNPYHSGPAPAPRTPRRPHTPASTVTPGSDKTPTSHVKNLFAKPRNSSPLATPTKRGVWPPPNTVILPPSKRSVGRWTPPSPEVETTIGGGEEADTKPIVGRETEGETKAVKKEIVPLAANDEKPELEVLKEISARPTDADIEALFPPAQQQTAISESSSAEASGGNLSNGHAAEGEPPIPGLSPTQMNGDAEEEVASASQRTQSGSQKKQVVAEGNIPSSVERPLKRVRMAGPIDEPDNPFTQPYSTSQPRASQQLPLSQKSQTSQRSRASSNSNQHSVQTASSAPTGTTIATDSTTRALYSRTAWTFRKPPPPVHGLHEAFEEQGLPSVEYQEPYYSNPVDVPLRAKMFAGRMFSLKGDAVKDLQDFESMALDGSAEVTPRQKRWLRDKNAHPPAVNSRYGWEYLKSAPTSKVVKDWCAVEDGKLRDEGELPCPRAPMSPSAVDIED